MAKIAVDRMLVIPAGTPSSGFQVSPADDGTTHFVVWGEGVRVIVALSVDEAVQTGVGAIMHAGEGAKRLAAIRPAPPLILNGGH
jgi:hypothetical protein